MKKIPVIALLFLATLAGALWLLGVFGPAPTTTPESGGTKPAPTTPGPSETAGGLTVPEPADEPDVEIPAFPSPVRILVLAGDPRSYTEWLHMMWEAVPSISWQTRYAAVPGKSSNGLPVLEGLPKVEDLDLANVLVVADADPAAAPAAFWDRVAERVRGGTLGLLLLPEMTRGKSIADVPALAGLLPVVAARVAAITPGGPVAGILPADRPYAVTEAGARHPASRLTQFPNWTRVMWDSRQKGKGRWGTKFVHPVEKVADGASVLVNVATGDGAGLPALVATAPAKGRVLWAGGFLDVIRDAYDTTRSYDLMRALVLHWTAWLATPPS